MGKGCVWFSVGCGHCLSYGDGQCESLSNRDRQRFLLPRFFLCVLVSALLLYRLATGACQPKEKRQRMTDIHFGNLVLEELQSQRRSVAWFAKEMSYTRGNMYNILKRKHLSSDFLIRASEKLHHDFFLDVSEILQASELAKSD